MHLVKQKFCMRCKKSIFELGQCRSVGRCRYRCWVPVAGAAASGGILAAMLGILAANILKDVSDQCCQCWLGWAAARAAINRSAQSPKEAGRLGWLGWWRGRAEAGARWWLPVPARRCRHRLSRVHPASRAALCAPSPPSQGSREPITEQPDHRSLTAADIATSLRLSCCHLTSDTRRRLSIV